MEKTYKNCQSCGMPLKRDPEGGGTNADGSKSVMYCSRCYQNGAFTKPDLTVAEMQELVKGKMREMGFPGFLAGLFTRNIPKLKRWS
ncbi:MAG: zinc ribbon domain-containing protein [Lewinellaceae bacterium]|nr:zinc ribbon domain-containing protein [Lewinellaceae bacterium]